MCNFFSVVSDPRTRDIMYFRAAIRKDIIAGESKYTDTDSHTSIADFFGYKGKDEDQLNKYEYNPLTEEFTVDQINGKDDSKRVEKFCRGLDYKTIVPELMIKPIVNPLTDRFPKTVTKKDKQRLAEWNSVRNSVDNSVWDSVENSVENSVGNSVRNSVRNSVWDSVGNSVRNSVRNSVDNSVWNSVWNSVGNSVRNSVWAYVSSFIDTKYEYDFTCLLELWERGYVPSFDGEVWRLHKGLKAEIAYTWKP